MKRNVKLFCLLSISAIILGASEKIGFKGMYLGDNKNIVCKKIKNMLSKDNIKYKEGHSGILKGKICGSMVFGNLNSALVAKYDATNKIILVSIGSRWVNELFKVHTLSGSKFADVLIENISWLNNGLDGMENGWIHQNTSEGWSFQIYENKDIFYETIDKPDFN